MEPMDINGGRFYARKLNSDDRIDDTPALAAALGHPVSADFVAGSHRDWAADTQYTWAVCEQTSVEMLAYARFRRATNTLEVLPTANVNTPVPNDPMLAPVTVGDAVREGEKTIQRWIHGYLNVDKLN